MFDAAALTIREHCAADDGRWNAFVAASPTGSLFQDLTFLGYHPPGRHAFRHLEVLHRDKLVAVMPGGLNADGCYCSPLGASTGGPALLPGLAAGDVLAIVGALQSYASGEGWRGMQIILPPAATYPCPSQILDFALHVRGFKLDRRAMCLVTPLHGFRGAESFSTVFKPKHRNSVRAGQRKGVAVTDHGAEALPAFFEVFDDTYRRHGRAPTHTHAEIADLAQRLPSRVRLWFATADSLVLAGALLLHLNARTAYAFYVCDREACRHMNGTTTLMAGVAAALAERGLACLDLGPSASDTHFNTGVVRFKEGIGAIPFCRDTYLWVP